MADIVAVDINPSFFLAPFLLSSVGTVHLITLICAVPTELNKHDLMSNRVLKSTATISAIPTGFLRNWAVSTLNSHNLPVFTILKGLNVNNRR